MHQESTQPHLDNLLRLLDLDQLDRDLFLGDPGPGEGRLFGGMVAAQSVAAAYRTVDEGQSMHSLHAYFLRGGRHGVPIRFVVYRVRDGRTFVTRDVVAYQAGEAIFDVSCSFTMPEPGMEHQEPMPEAPGPEGLKPWTWGDEVGDLPEEMKREMTRWQTRNPLEMLSCDPAGEQPEGQNPSRRVWVRLKGSLPEDERYHAAMLAYASDSGLLGTARHPRRHRAPGPPRSREHMGASASLDHSIWFHHAPRFDGWLLFTSESPIAHSARARIYGAMHRQDGARILSVVQEGLVRLPRE
jgi:acyl-CoA thioesterase-2